MDAERQRALAIWLNIMALWAVLFFTTQCPR